MRAALALAALAAIAACSGRDGIPGEAIACVLGNAGEQEEGCRVERLEKDGSALLVIHHPDGGFRRFSLSPDGKSLVAADGADPATNTARGDTLEVAVGADRYQIPLSLLEPDNER